MLHTGHFRETMRRGFWLVLLAGVVLRGPGTGLTRSDDRSVASSTPAVPAAERREQTPADENQDQQKAANLVRALYASEAWIDSVRSILIRTQVDQTRVERPDDYSRTITWAWDKGRIRDDEQIRDTKDAPVSSWTTDIWDSSLARSCSKSANEDHYIFGDKAGQFFEQTATSRMCNYWEIAGCHRFWWLPVDVDQSRSALGLAPEDFELAGDEEVNGRPCHVVQSSTGCHRFHVGLADGRLYRRTWLFVRREFAGYDRLALYRQVGGEAIKTVYHWEPWLESLEPQEQRRARHELASAESKFMRPGMRQSLDDYREVAPGCWFPFRRIQEGYEFRKLPKINDVVSIVQSRLDETVTEMIVNQALPDEMFQIELTDGVKVMNDWRYDPPIAYTYRKDQTEAERAALCETERQRVAGEAAKLEQHLVPVKSRVGTAPPPLPKDGWIAGGPLSWEALRGKVVVLHFCDLERTNYQRACQIELPVMQGWHEGSDKSGVVVIGVHRPTNDVAAVERILAEFGATYPVVIDAPSDEAKGLGLLHDWFETYWWPFAVVVDQRGIVAGYGQLWHGTIVDRNGIDYLDGGNESWMPNIAPQIRKLTAKEGPAKAQDTNASPLPAK